MDGSRQSIARMKSDMLGRGNSNARKGNLTQTQSCAGASLVGWVGEPNPSEFNGGGSVMVFNPCIPFID